MLLKPLSKAVADKDHIYGVIKSSALCHSGGRQMYTAPDPKQQAKLMAASIDKAGINPETISYVESAANGSVLGDPIEVIALTNAFSQYTDKKRFCALGSVKSNLGHLEAASGMSQLAKVLLQMERETLVPTINAKPQNPNIALEQTAFYLQEKTEYWERLKDAETGDIVPRRSMINSFGAGGAYANLIVEEYISPNSDQARHGDEEYIFPVSAKTKWSFEAYLERLAAFLEKTPSLHPAAIASALQKERIIRSIGRHLRLLPFRNCWKNWPLTAWISGISISPILISAGVRGNGKKERISRLISCSKSTPFICRPTLLTTGLLFISVNQKTLPAFRRCTVMTTHT
ncbi:polyketide synthase [Bacillus velezensis]|nr:polyketide synthase [Bacillus velezensis]